jgi:hypothetical protein
MVTTSELQTLENIQYRSKVKFALLAVLLSILFLFAFLNFFPIGDKIRGLLKTHLTGSGCHPDFSEIRIELLFIPKIIISDLSLPASCLGRDGETLKFNYVKLNWQFINFAPFGIPFRVDTEIAGQPISVYYVLGINQQMIRLKDQNLNFTRLQPLLGDQFKLGGNMTVDLSLLLSENIVKELSLKAASKDFQIPAQNIQGFSLPGLKINNFFLSASSATHPRVVIEEINMGTTDSPVRAKLKGRVDLQSGNMPFSPLELSGEVAFSPSFKENFPVDLLLGGFPQKDGFYQVKLGGTLGQPRQMAQ